MRTLLLKKEFYNILPIIKYVGNNSLPIIPTLWAMITLYYYHKNRTLILNTFYTYFSTTSFYTKEKN